MHSFPTSLPIVTSPSFLHLLIILFSFSLVIANITLPNQSGGSRNNTRIKQTFAEAGQQALQADRHETSYADENVNCDSESCIWLRESFIKSIESESCRSFFENGKCPYQCTKSLSSLTTNTSWTPCTKPCHGDIIMSAVDPWLRLCNSYSHSSISTDLGNMQQAVSDFLFSNHSLSSNSTSATLLLSSPSNNYMTFMGLLISCILFYYVLRKCLRLRLGRIKLISRKQSDPDFLSP